MFKIYIYSMFKIYKYKTLWANQVGSCTPESQFEYWFYMEPKYNPFLQTDMKNKLLEFMR